MDNKIFLYAENEKVESGLTEKYNELEIGKIAGVVYQDTVYQIVIKTKDLDICSVRILLNNRESKWLECKIIKNNNTSCIVFDSQNGFLMLFGSAKFTVVFSYIDGSEKLLFSNNIGVAIKETDSDLQDSVEEMLNEILDKEYNFLQKKGYTRKFTKSRTYFNPRISLELDMIDNVLMAYSKNLPYFMRDLKFQINEVGKIDEFEKLKSIKANTIRHIAIHSEQFERVNYSTGIFAYGYNMQPKKTLVSMGKEKYDIYENEIILGFLKYILLYLHEKQKYIDKLLNEGKLDSIANDTLKDGYVLSERIIRAYTERELNKYLTEIHNKFHMLDTMYMQYKRTLLCKEIQLKGKPKNTAIFQNVQHYRNIFIIINKWFNLGEYDFSNEKRILNFITADQIYEYYCMLMIFCSLIELGYDEDFQSRNSYQYDYIEKYYKVIEEDNTFYFKKDDGFIVLYCQPMIYSKFSDKTNGITLFRTDKSYWTPDFILKSINYNGKTKYAILDAKWRPRRNVDFKEMVFKYVYSISNLNNDAEKPFMWILQGKEDGESHVCFHNRGCISKKQGNKFVYESGIVKVTPKSGNEKLINILNVFLGEE